MSSKETMTKKRSNAVSQGPILWLQWIGGTGAMLMILLCGTMIGWTSPYTAQLTAEDSPLPITLEEASWVGSFLTLGRLFGVIPGVVCVNYFGGKKTLVITCVPVIVGSVCIILAKSVAWLYAARLLSGLGLGMTFCTCPLYLGEIASSHIRGTLVSFAMSGMSIGILAGNVIGAYVSMSVFAWMSLILSVIVTIIFMWLPESPHHLVRKHKIEDAKVAMIRYNPGANADVEVKSLQDFIKASDSITLMDRLREFNIPENRKAGVIIVLLFMFMQLSGGNVVMFYMESIVTEGGLTVIPPATMVIVASAVGNLAGFAPIYLSDRCGRRMLMVISSAGVGASMLGLGAHFTLLNDGFDPAKLQWLLISSLIGYETFVFIGVTPVPSIVVSELFAPNIKSIASCIGNISLGVFSFISSKTYQPLLNIIGKDYVFWLYAVVMMSAIVFSLEVMPETKGKSLQEIQDTLHNKYVVVRSQDCESQEK